MKPQLLKRKIVEAGTTVERIAAIIGIDRSTFYRKMKNEGKTFTVEEMNKIVSALHLSKEEAVTIFFSHE